MKRTTSRARRTSTGYNTFAQIEALEAEARRAWEQEQEAPPVPVFSFADAGIRSAVSRFASDWGDAQAAESYHAGLIVDAGELDGQGAIEAQACISRGDVYTDDAPAFVRAFAGAWADGYAARIAFAFTHGY